MRLVGQEGTENDRSPVSWRNQQGVGAQAVKVMLHLHGDNHETLGLPVQHFLTVQNLGIKMGDNLRHSGAGERLAGRNDRNQLRLIGQLAPERRRDGIDLHWVGSIDDDTQNLTTLGLKRIHRHQDGADDVIYVIFCATGHQQHRTPQILGDGDVDIKLERGAFTGEVGSNTEDEIKSAFESHVFFNNAPQNLILFSLCQQIVDLVYGPGVSVLVIDVEFEVLQD